MIGGPMAPQEHHLRRTLRGLITDRTKRVLTISLSINYLLLEFIVINVANPMSDLSGAAPLGFLLPMVILSVILAVLFGLAVALELNSTRIKRALWGWVLILLGAVLGLISSGCPGCTSPLLDITGSHGGFSAYPLGGLELKLIALILLGYALWETSGKLTRAHTSILEEPSMTSSGQLRRWSKVRLWIPRSFLIASTIIAFYLLPLMPA